MKRAVLLLIVLTSLRLNAQDTLLYNLYKDKIVLYSDLGFNSAPFSIKGDFSNNIDKLRYKHNQKIVLGFGFAYKWLAIRLGFALPGTLRPKSRYGSPNYQDLGIQFSAGRSYWDIDLRNYLGYVIKDANQWNDTLNGINPNAHMAKTRSVSLSFNSWVFKSKDFKMAAVIGKKGDFKKSFGTRYLKWTFNFFGSGNDLGPLMPQELVDTVHNIYRADAFSAMDIGVVPGYAYVHRWDNWQASVFGGLGGVLQAKFFQITPENFTKGHIGLAPRIDLRLSIGYSVPKYFIWLQSNFDVKSIKFQEFSYKQTYNSLQIVGGIRLDKKRKSKI